MTIVSYIYKHMLMSNMLKEHTKRKNLLRPTNTRFATSHLTLQRVHQLKHNLRSMFTSETWETCSYANELQGKEYKTLSWWLLFAFWSGVAYVLKLEGPLLKVLRLIDNEKKSWDTCMRRWIALKKRFRKLLLEMKASTRMSFRLLIKDGRMSSPTPSRCRPLSKSSNFLRQPKSWVWRRG